MHGLCDCAPRRGFKFWCQDFRGLLLLGRWAPSFFLLLLCFLFRNGLRNLRFLLQPWICAPHPRSACSKSHGVGEWPLALLARPRILVGLVWPRVCLPARINATTHKCETCLSAHPPTQPRPPNHHTTHLKIHPSTNQDMHLGTDRPIHQPITNPSQ